MKYPILPYAPFLKVIARKLRWEMTHSETILWQGIRRNQILGCRFQRQRPISRYVVDFYCKELKLAIEVDGYSHESDDARARDAERQKNLESMGVTFLRFSDADVNQDTDKVLQMIEIWIKERKNE